MNWHNYVACFFAGMFLANSVPHYVSGISGNRFPSPFAKPPGKGLSSALVNVVWGMANMVAGYVLFRSGGVASGDPMAVGILFAGMAALSIPMSVRFSKKDAS